MRFVSSILSKNGACIDSFEYMLSEGHDYQVKHTELSDDLNLTLGRGINYQAVTGLVVCHNQKTATFHRYINSAETRQGVTPLRHRVADRCSADDPEPNGVVTHNSILEVSFKTDIISVYGPTASVATLESSDREKIICTLYDIFIMLCRRLHRNLMSYETVHMFSTRNLWQTQVRLIHTQEAERYYAKMYMEAIGES